ncbi:MAG: phosphoribosylaminoimidazolesuccinocarboxamide synthase [Dehalococcoidia bacterium]|nr:phosphoribosylaminoimidazolesuccinocarboxamide synthase [Dehalococcoidia bacterium]|tara:strand:+ start:7109 stop:8005 length:897 start_codon:yes stop_codon:yes gene_type:complete
MENKLKNTNLFNKIHSGKVRDIYELNKDLLLFVATDRISAFDVIMNEVVPGKGIILNKLSAFWFDLLDKYENHYVSSGTEFDFSEFKNHKDIDPKILQRSTIVKKANRIDMECVVRGYITGSAWKEYEDNNTMNGMPLNKNIVEAQKFETPIFTPSTKASEGHDQPLSKSEGQNLVGIDLYNKLEQISIDIYQKAHSFCSNKGIILADTKFEFGIIDNKIILIDEVLTPDSSRFWKSEDYFEGKSPNPYDKQFLRNWLNDQTWDKNPPPPNVPNEIINKTLLRYLEIYEIITNDKFKI